MKIEQFIKELVRIKNERIEKGENFVFWVQILKMLLKEYDKENIAEATKDLIKESRQFFDELEFLLIKVTYK